MASVVHVLARGSMGQCWALRAPLHPSNTHPLPRHPPTLPASSHVHSNPPTHINTLLPPRAQGTADAVRQYLWLFEDSIRDGVEDFLILSGKRDVVSLPSVRCVNVWVGGGEMEGVGDSFILSGGSGWAKVLLLCGGVGYMQDDGWEWRTCSTLPIVWVEVLGGLAGFFAHSSTEI